MQRRWNIGIGLFGASFALLALFLWFPNDIKGDFIELTRAGKQEPGDAFFPVLIVVFIAFLSLVQIVTGFLLRRSEDDIAEPPISPANVLFLAMLAAIIFASLGLMYWLGPLVVSISGVAEEYRHVSDTAPYKYIGMVLGGFALTFTLISWAEGRIRFERQSSAVCFSLF